MRELSLSKRRYVVHARGWLSSVLCSLRARYTFFAHPLRATDLFVVLLETFGSMRGGRGLAGFITRALRA